LDWLPKFQDIEEKLTNLRGMNKEELAFELFPHFLAEVLSRYFRMDVVGGSNIPKEGSAILAPNHSGYSGFDAFLLGHHITKQSARQAQILTHKLWFASQVTGKIMEKMGFIEATTNNGIEKLKEDQLVVLFPEGEYGNFKPTTKRYHLQKFKRGFIRMAIRTHSPIVPTLIVGAEETHINLAQLRITKYLKGKGLVLPVPLNIVPLPVKWQIHFLEPVYLPYDADKADDSELVHEWAEDIRETMQGYLTKVVQERQGLF